MVRNSILVAVLLWAAQPDASSQPAPGDVSAAEALDVAHARAQLQLAQVNLQRIEQMNKRVSRAVPATIVAEYRRDVEVAKVQAEQAGAQVPDGEFAIWLRRAEGNWKSAEASFKEATAANARAAGTFGPLNVERFRLRAQTASLQFQRGQKLATADPARRLEWQLDVLNDEVARLREESRIAPYTRLYPAWWY